MPVIVYREQKGSALTTAELDANLTNINAETVDNSAIFNLRPSLDVDIVGSKTLSPLATFSRASTGTYYDANGVLRTAGVNEPRFNYDPATGEFKGLLVEESRTNLLTYSEQFDNAAWTKSNATITANAVVAPDGTLTSDKLVADSTSAMHYLSVSLGTTLSNINFTIYAKAAEYDRLIMGGLPGQYYVGFNLISGMIESSVPISNISTASISAVGGGWYRCRIVLSTAGYVSLYPFNTTYTNGALNPVFTGSGTSGIYIWGAQLEQGSTPTSYIPTTSAAVTRQADQLSISKTTSSWFNSVNGTLSLSHDVPATLPLLGEGSNTITNSLGAGTTNIDYSNSQLSVVSQSGQSNYTQGIFNFDSDMYILGNSTTKANAHVKYLKFYPNNAVNSTPDGSGFILDNGFALLQEDGSVLFQE